MATQLEPFKGQEVFHAAPMRVFEALTDPDSLASMIPDLVSHERVNSRELKCIVRPGFSFLRASLRMVMTISEAQAPAAESAGRIVLNIVSQGIGAAMKIECRVVIHDTGSGGSRVEWEAGVQELSGLITAVSPTLIRSAADKVIHDGWQAMRQRVEAA